MKPLISRWTSAAAFSLVEVALALGVASFCLITVVALVPLGVSTGQIASDQSTVASILTHVLADLRATPMTSPPGGQAISTQYGITIPATGATTLGTTTAPTRQVLYFGNSAQEFFFPLTASTTAPANSRYRVTVTFFAPASGSREATGVTLLASWPPQTDPSTGTPTGRVQIYAGLNRN